MRLVGDESVDHPVLLRLRTEGHTVWSVAEEASGIQDSQVLELAHQQQALLITGDKDFGLLVFLQRRVTHGVVLLRLAGLSVEQKAERVARVLASHGPEMYGKFTVIRPDQVLTRFEFGHLTPATSRRARPPTAARRSPW